MPEKPENLIANSESYDCANVCVYRIFAGQENRSQSAEATGRLQNPYCQHSHGHGQNQGKSGYNFFDGFAMSSSF
jgi:hypothetical protein